MQFAKSMLAISLRQLGIVHDILIAALSMTIAMSIAWGWAPLFNVWQIWLLIGGYTALSAICFPFFSLNSGAWRYASLLDVLSIVKAVTVINLAFLLLHFVLFRGAYLPRSTIVISWFIMIVGLGGPRLAYRLMKERRLDRRTLAASAIAGTRRHLLLYGFNDNADLFIRNSRRNRRHDAIVGIIDEKAKNRRRQLHGIPVLGALDDLEKTIGWAEHRGTPVGELVVTEVDMPPAKLSRIVATCAPLGVTVKRLPDISQTGKVDENRPIEPQSIALEDLLGRQEVDLDIAEVERLIKDRLVIVTGAGGSIGSELVRQIARFAPSRLVLVDNCEFNLWAVTHQVSDEFPAVPLLSRIVDVRHRNRIRALFDEVGPDVVFHAAALKHVPIVEDNPIEGIDTNLIGTRNVADATLAARAAAFVMISTDKAVNPSNVMGATKRAAEAYCQALDLDQDATRFITVRFGNVLGSTGSVIPLFRSQLEKGGPLTVTHPHITRFFMTIPEASRLILHAAGHGMTDTRTKGQIFVLDMGKPIRVAELAERVIQLAGLKPHIDIDIRFVGLRKGEKLYEELFSEEETREETGRPGLLIACSRVSDVKLLSRSFANIEAAVVAGDADRALEILKRIVPEYRPAIIDGDDSATTRLVRPVPPTPA
ncbi:nucleoside-diphosphate sugar epimerase/dehydratase [Aurantimonas sp. A2-1-M11]|uniref:polysaccharide biosynthesis protein n=1 Tax=Aurantimonas sp. A2-1-M11 TaxID=3113712 RepID=UPI002F93FC98